MSREVRRRRGTTAQHAAFTGALGEVTVDTDKKTAVVHDGAQAGGFPLAHEDIAELWKRLPETIYTDNHTLALSASGVMHIFNKATAVTADLPAVAGTDGEVLFVRNINDGVLTIDPNSSEQIEGAATMDLANGFGAMLWPNAGKTAWRSMVFRSAPGGDAASAADISYDNSETSLPNAPDTVQEAMEELYELATAPSISMRAYKNTNQTLPESGSPVVLTFEAENWDEGSYYNTTNSRWTPPAGRYTVTAAYLVTAGLEDGALFGIAIRKNGTTVQEANYRANGTSQQSAFITGTVEVDGDDYIEIASIIGGTGTNTAFAGESYTYFTGFKF